MYKAANKKDHVSKQAITQEMTSKNYTINACCRNNNEVQTKKYHPPNHYSTYPKLEIWKLHVTSLLAKYYLVAIFLFEHDVMIPQELYLITGVALNSCSVTPIKSKGNSSPFMLSILLFLGKKGMHLISSTTVTNVYFSRASKEVLQLFSLFLSSGKKTIYENMPQNGTPHNMLLLLRFPTYLWPVVYLVGYALSP